jgi:NH3-dependent NAD+ synthetase
VATTQISEDVQPVHARQENVHQHDVKGLSLRAFKPFRTVLAPGDMKAASIQLIVNECAKHGIVFNGEYARAVNAGGIHWRLRLILKAAIIRDCATAGNGDRSEMCVGAFCIDHLGGIACAQVATLRRLPKVEKATMAQVLLQLRARRGT